MIFLFKDQMYHDRTKHIDVKYHFISEVITKKDVLLYKIDSAHNRVDMLTKPLPLAKFEHCLNVVNLHQASV